MKISKSPRKSLSDKKEYKVIKLTNGLKVLLVKQEPQCGDDVVETKLKQNIAAVALCVGSGCFNDPIDVQGMSHFLEHMIFNMGSEKYPKENEFDQYVSVHGGFDNAYTECEHTLFHFDIIEKHLAGALDRFTQFFIAPLMSVDSMEREMEAVESEFQSNSIDDEVRVVQIYCSLVSPSHPASNFIWGNLETLKHGISKEKLNERLHVFKNRNYVAEKMWLCIQSSIDMTRLERTVVKYFSDIPRGSEGLQTTSKVKSYSDVFKPSFHEKIFFVKSTADKCKLLMTFLLPPMEKEMKYLEYLAYLIQSEGAGSLIEFFMDEQLALKVKAKVSSQSFEGNSYFTLFTIEVNLTSKGFEDFDQVLEAIFAFLLLLKTTTLDDHKKRYTEFKEIKETLFKYRKENSAIENVQELAVNMKYFDKEDVIIGRDICPDFDEKVIKKIIEGVNERKFNLLILSDKYPKYDKEEQWFGTKYAEVDFPSTYTKLWNERWLRNELFLPKPNDFICRHFSLIPPGETNVQKYPTKIFENSTCESFYKLDSQFNLPHGFVYVFFLSSVTESSVSNLNMTSIYSMCVKNFLSDKLYSATIAGYNYKLNSVDNGLILRLNGFSEKLLSIVDIITNSIKNLECSMDKTVFETFKKELKKNCHNCLNDGNLLNDDCRLAIIKKHHRSFYDRHENVDSLNYPEFKEFCSSFIKSLKVKILVQGNIDESCANGITQLIITNLSIGKCDTDEKKVCPEIFKIPLGSSYVKVKSLRHNGTNSILKNYYQVGKATIHSECMTEFLVGVINEPLFDTLRSHEQLGYGVACSVRKNGGIVGLLITVEYQENKYSAHVIDEKIEEFLRNFFDKLKAMTDKEFSSVKRSIVSLKLIADSDLEKEVNRNWDEVRTGEYVFDRNILEAFEIERLTRENAIKFYDETFLSTINARKLSVQVIGNACAAFKIIKSLDEEKSSRECFVNDLAKFTENLETFI